MIVHEPLCPFGDHPAPELCRTCDAIRKSAKDAKNELLHFFANEIMKLFLKEHGK